MNFINKSLHAYTELYWLVQDGKIKSENIFNLLEFFWPSFIEKDGFVFIMQNFDREEFDSLIKQGDNSEYWLNICLIDEFFSDGTDEEDKTNFLLKKLTEILKVKLKNDFPDKTFAVEILFSEEYGDCGLTFYQTNNTNLYSEIKCRELIGPYVRENHNMQSPTGRRPGISRIRKPRSEEIPPNV